MELKHYSVLSKINTSKMTKQKGKFTYLTWSLALDETLKKYPDMTYEIIKFEGKPYFVDETGAMVYTNMTIEGITREMWLPVLDGANKPMKAQEYKYKTSYGEKICQAITMFDVNTALMRCLVKNIGVFGLGLNIYAGEDLPLGTDEEGGEVIEKPKPKTIKVEAKKPSVADIKTKAQYEKCNEASKALVRAYYAKEDGTPFIEEKRLFEILT